MKIILSNTAHDAYHRVLGELKKRLSQGGEHVVIVPDKFTASSERGIIETLGLSASFNVSVTSFTRLAEKTIGKRIKKCLTPQGSVMTLAKVIEEKRADLKYYGKAARVNGFADEFYAALTAIRNSGITSSALKTAGFDAPAGFSDKLHDISVIYDGYLAALQDRHSDSSTRLEAFADYLQHLPPQAVHYYVIDFYSFKAPELAVLGGLAKSSLSLTVGLVGGFDNPNRRIYCDAVSDRLKEFCDAVEIEESREELNPVADVISRRLFSYEPPETRTENNGKIRLVKTRNRSEEILAAVTDIRRKVMNGARYKDFEIVLADADAYVPELKSAFLRYGIPFFIDTREMLAEQTKVRCILDAIAVTRSRYKRTEVIEYVKNPLFCHYVEGGADSVFRFENYVLRYNIDYSRFTKPFVLGEDEERECAEKVRVALCESVRCLDFDGEIRSEEFVARARKFLDSRQEAWQAHTQKLTETSLYYAKCADQVDEKTDEVLDEIEEALCASGDISYFENVFKSMLRSVKIALVPTFLDAVYVGTTENRYLGGGDIYILGATVGSFPSGKGGGAVLSPKDEELFSAVGLKITPGQRERVYTELMSITEIMKKPKGELVISCPESGAGGELRPSTVFSELRGMVGEKGRPIPVNYVGFDDMYALKGEERARKLQSVYATPSACYYGILSGVFRKSDAEILGAAYDFVVDEGARKLGWVYSRQTPPDRLGAETAAAVAGEGTVRTSASRLEKFFTCPYAHYFNYVLGLRRREEAGFQNTDNGIILHAVLEAFFKAVRKDKVRDDNLRAVAEKAFDNVVNSIARIEVMKDDPAMKRALDRLREESVSLCRALFDVQKRSKYKPYYIEEYIGGSEISPLSFKVDGRKVELTGKIDRVDVLDGKLAVIDYKTYKSADLPLKEIYSGEKIQLYIYLKAIEESKGWKPVGVFYLPISSGFIKDGEQRYKYKGHVTRSLEESAKLDSLFAESPEESILPYKKAARAKDPFELSKDVHFDDADFFVITEYVKQLVEKGAREILSGVIKPTPADGDCSRCDFQGICKFTACAKKETPSVKMHDFYVATGAAEASDEDE